jgi:DNA invertase Pin-like site-specific DNA recombinase
MRDQSQATGSIKAAEYVRMSTEHQQYSIANQREAIGRYAQDHNMVVVKTYTDAAKSGVTLEGRDALQTLLADVENGSADYSAVLVYDVSRWGRFQDVDESAYNEYRCKRAKISVHYCAEQFVNDGSISSALLKAIKRAMAGEYSRELSVKTFAGKCRLVEAGFRGGGSPGYGLRRLLVDQHGNPKLVLKRGELKSIITDRTIQIPGPPEEVEIVRKIYRMFVEERLVPRVIAERLNELRVESETGRPWTRAVVQNIVTNPKYTGANVLNRRDYKLGTSPRGRRNPRDRWIRRENVFEPIIDSDVFKTAQEIAASRSIHYTDEYLLDRLKQLLNRKGRLSASLIDADPGTPSNKMYSQRFGSLYEAYRRIGFEPGGQLPVLDLARKAREYRSILLGTLVCEIVAAGATADLNRRSGIVAVNNEFTIRAAIAPCLQRSFGNRWRLHLGSSLDSDFILIARLVPTNDSIQDFYILPQLHSWPKRVTVEANRDLFTGMYRFADLSFLKNLVRRASVRPRP